MTNNNYHNEMQNYARLLREYRRLLPEYYRLSGYYAGRVLFWFIVLAASVFVLFYQRGEIIFPGTRRMFMVYLIFTLPFATSLVAIILYSVRFFRLDKPEKPDKPESPPSRPSRLTDYLEQDSDNRFDNVSRPSRIMVVENKKARLGSVSLYPEQWDRLYDALKANKYIWKRKVLESTKIFQLDNSNISITNDNNYRRITDEFVELGFLKDLGRKGYRLETKGRVAISALADRKVVT